MSIFSITVNPMSMLDVVGVEEEEEEDGEEASVFFFTAALPFLLTKGDTENVHVMRNDFLSGITMISRKSSAALSTRLSLA